MNLRLILAAGLLLASALTCDAMSLGRTRGVIWIGQPLDLSIPVRLEPGEDASALCVAADVFYADIRVSSPEVRVFAEPGPTSDEATVRVRSSARVDEPVVNIYLRAGCKQALTRRYVLLAEVPVDAVAESMAPDSRGPATPGVRAAQTRLDAGSADSVQGASPGAGTGGAGRVARGAAGALPAAPGAATRRKPAGSAAVDGPVVEPARVQSVVRKRPPEPGVGRARLKLDPADLLIERDPVLRASTALLTAPEEQDGGSRRAGAAALWRAINATPEEVLRDAQRLQALQTEVVALRSRSQKSEAAVADLEPRLKQAQVERYGNGLVYGLLVALLAALGAAAHFWRRSGTQAKEPKWWGAGDGAPAVDAGLPQAQAVPVQSSSATGTVRGPDLDVDLDLDLNAPAAPARSKGSLAAQAERAARDDVEFQTSQSGGERAVKVEELFDIQQQAEFFISLGKFEQAVEMLRNHITENAETSALAYLDLLKIYHLQGREKEYALVRQEFNDVFNAEAPEFSAFGQQTRGLESYKSAMSRVMALWPTPKVLDVIEESILRKPGQGSLVFELEAYRELLMLYSIAKEIVGESDSGAAFVSSGTGLLSPRDAVSRNDDGGENGRVGFHVTNIQPLPTAVGPLDPINPMLRVPASANLGLDIDLSELAPESTPPPKTVAPAVPDSTKLPASHLIDFDIFDMATQTHASRRRKP